MGYNATKPLRYRYYKFDKNKVEEIDYKNLSLLKNFINDTNKIMPSRVTRIKSSHQRRLAQAIKHARYLALLAYSK